MARLPLPDEETASAALAAGGGRRAAIGALNLANRAALATGIATADDLR